MGREVQHLEPAGRAVWARAYRWRMLATLYTGVTRYGYFSLWIVPSGAVSFEIAPGDRPFVLGLVAAVGAAMAIVSREQSRRAFEDVRAWLDGGGPPTAAQQRALLDQPRRQARGTLGYWCAGGVIAAANYLWLFEPDPAAAAVIVLALAALGSHAAGFTFLLTERALRPVAARAMSASLPARLTILSVRNRFLMAFALGPGVTILGIVILVSMQSASGPDLAPAVWPVVVLGAVDGYLLVALAAASVTEPVEEMRRAMRRMVDGDLAVGVPVDSGSEIGLLQVGFNRMLTGLRERERLRQLLDRSAGDDVAERLVAGGADFRGHERDASVMMVDLVGSVGLTEADPTEVLATLNALFDAVVRVTGDHGGWVNRFVGDAALCIFGAPVPSPSHASHALAAARALNHELHALRQDRPWLDVGVAVSSGRVLAADVGTAARFEFTVIGDAPNEAARLTELAKRAPARLVASGASVAAAGEPEAARWVRSREVILRGRSQPTQVFEPLGSLAAEIDGGVAAGDPRHSAVAPNPRPEAS